MALNHAAPIISSREFKDTPRDLFRAFADPVGLASWWGPHGFVNTISQFDFKPGGRWLMVMQSPDGTQFPMEKRFVDLVPDTLIVFDHLQAGHEFRMTMQFEALPNGTKVTWTMIFADPLEAERLRSFIEPANEQNFDRLATFLSTGRVPAQP